MTSTFLFTIVALTVGLFSCDKVVSVVSNDEMPRIMSEEIPIGVVVARTGHHAEPYGFPMQRGFELAREEINNLGDVNLTFITVDDQSSPDGAKAAVQHLVDQGVPLSLGLLSRRTLKRRLRLHRRIRSSLSVRSPPRQV